MRRGKPSARRPRSALPPRRRREAAADRAEARREEAQAEADAISIRAEAKKKDLLVEAEGKRAIVEAENVLSPELIGMKVDIARLEALPGIVAEMVKPAEKIDSIRIHQVGGLNGGTGGGTSTKGDKPRGEPGAGFDHGHGRAAARAEEAG